jgi:Ni,Fe-hydrogenase III component G
MQAEEFKQQIDGYSRADWRLALITACPLKAAEGQPENACELIWTFEKGQVFEHVRHLVSPADEIPALGAAFPAAYLYENEIQEMFGLRFTGLQVDFKGQLYATRTKVPFSPKAIAARLEAKGKKP